MKKYIVFLVLALTILFYGCQNKDVSAIPKYNTYTNKNYQVSFKYPNTWKANTIYIDRYEGPDGFFQVSASSGQNITIDEIAKLEASHQLMPYGSNPTIKVFNTNGLSCRLIIPSSDQLKEMKNQAALIVKYPSPIEILGSKYYYFILWADKDHIEQIGKTLKFTDLNTKSRDKNLSSTRFANCFYD